MKRILIFILFIFSSLCSNAQELTTAFEKSNGTETATYQEGINFYKKLAQKFPQIDIREMGKTDSGEPLHLVVFNKDEKFRFSEIQQSGKPILFINNGIHPGESDGIDASMMILRNWAQNISQHSFLDSVIVAVIPFYNVGGALNRNSTTRTNQNGPEAYGFRGNAQNYDLNRDFIKMDSKNAFAFAEIFHQLDPDVFIDTHVTNGTDHQHVVTVLTTQHNKLGGQLGEYLEEEFEPMIFEEMEAKGRNPIEYINVKGNTPENGWTQFWDAPRYSTGYTTLFQTFGFMTEDHMWKDYKTRVENIYDFLTIAAELTAKEGAKIQKLKSDDREQILEADSLPIIWKNDKDEFKMITLDGYSTSYPESQLTGNSLLKYDRNDTFEKDIPFYNHYKVEKSVRVPNYYVIPQAWFEVINRLKTNDVKMEVLKKDTVISVEVYHVDDFQTVSNPYEGHYLHYDTKVKSSVQQIAFRKGDYLIDTRQKSKRYLVETLEPEAQDSFFNWNFFDSILQQKEGFSSYVFEPKATEILANLPSEEQAEFYEKQESDSTFSSNNYAQLDWIFKRSKHYEKSHKRYPVYRLMSE
ncbi:M14 family metallopeptidase [Marivirga salinae]|uniref:M14 family metallopeptidase n=1 Tax=Marivirga salinarum TaxID=3059078 RepID=A0AA49GAT2_9BACT|nr:M14 family metallopeptidase [Marivirga sp. BDSF4-3]WKK76808.2 M14 family metallopeptidase [Marivirga sp. BDSF4-3]